MEERVLGLGQTGKFLHIVDNQYVNSLVEVDEVVYGVFPYGIRVLHLKKVGGNVQHTLCRVKFFDFGPDSVYQMSLSHTGSSVDKQRIECRLFRMFGYSLPYGAGQLVAYSFDEVFKTVVSVQLRIQILRHGSLQRTGRPVATRCLYLGTGRQRLCVDRLDVYGQMMGLVYHQAIFQLRSFSENSSYDGEYQPAEMFRQEFIKILAWQAECQYLLLERDDLNRFKPCPVLFLVYIIANDGQTTFP